MRKYSMLFGVLAIVFLIVVKTEADDLDKGTKSIGASSNIFFQRTDYDNEYLNVVSISLQAGYFYMRNFEIGSTIMYRYSTNDSSTSSLYLIPYLTYYIPLAKKINFYLSLGGGLGEAWYDSDLSYSSNIKVITYYGEVGLDYFFTKNVAVNLGIRGQANRYEYDNEWCENCDDESEENFIRSYIGLKLYF